MCVRSLDVLREAILWWWIRRVGQPAAWHVHSTGAVPTGRFSFDTQPSRDVFPPGEQPSLASPESPTAGGGDAVHGVHNMWRVDTRGGFQSVSAKPSSHADLPSWCVAENG